MMVGAENMRVLQVLADATNVIAEGEVMQLMNCHNPEVSEAGYLEVIRCKTAKLFEAATRLGAILGAAGASRRMPSRSMDPTSAPRFSWSTTSWTTPASRP
jgi:octaprenyl-diphosphate synthase